MKGRRLWCKVAAHGGSIRVYAAKGPLTVDDHPVNAYWDKDKNEILVASRDNVAAMCSDLHHELLHVCFGGHGDEARAKALGGSGRTSSAQIDEREESVILFLEPVQFDLLVRNGFLRYPKPPRVK